MTNVRMVVEYNGSFFHGWQSQPNLETVYSELRRALNIVLKDDIKNIIASGRTDAGVHARAQVVNFHVDKLEMDLQTLSYAISSILRYKLSVKYIDIAPDDFHATRDSIKKRYSYHILNRPNPPCIEKGLVWHVAKKLDITLMQNQAKKLIGVHDFSSFRASGCTARSPVKEIFDISITKENAFGNEPENNPKNNPKNNNEKIVISITGSGFLKQMVRNIVGTLVEIGKGNDKDILEILEKKDRTFAGPTAPAYGLFLDYVEYYKFLVY